MTAGNSKTPALMPMDERGVLTARYFSRFDAHVRMRASTAFALRERGWMLQDGGRFGCDFLAYKQPPGTAHAAWMVLCLFDETAAKLLRTISDPKPRFSAIGSYVQAAMRIARTSNKNLVVAVAKTSSEAHTVAETQTTCSPFPI